EAREDLERRARRRRAVDAEAGDDVDATVTGAVREGATESSSLHLLGGALRVVTRRRAVDDATAGELRRAGRSLAGTTGALLLVRLAPTTGDLSTGLGVGRALARSGALGDDDLVDERDVRLDVEHLGRKLGGAGLLARR